MSMSTSLAAGYGVVFLNTARGHARRAYNTLARSAKLVAIEPASLAIGEVRLWSARDKGIVVGPPSGKTLGRDQPDEFVLGQDNESP
jgi:hypothetical protein